MAASLGLLGQALREAAMIGDADVVRGALVTLRRSGMPRSGPGATALHEAIARSYWSVARLILDANPDLSVRDKAGRTAYQVSMAVSKVPRDIVDRHVGFDKVRIVEFERGISESNPAHLRLGWHHGPELVRSVHSYEKDRAPVRQPAGAVMPVAPELRRQISDEARSSLHAALNHGSDSPTAAAPIPAPHRVAGADQHAHAHHRRSLAGDAAAGDGAASPSKSDAEADEAKSGIAGDGGGLDRIFPATQRPVGIFAGPQGAGTAGSSTIRVENWSVNALHALHGRTPQGSTWNTSAIVAVSGREVTTSSGSKYQLGALDPRVQQVLVGRRKDAVERIDPEDPFKAGDAALVAQYRQADRVVHGVVPHLRDCLDALYRARKAMTSGADEYVGLGAHFDRVAGAMAREFAAVIPPEVFAWPPSSRDVMWNADWA